jgi:hypothetical protein
VATVVVTVQLELPHPELDGVAVCTTVVLVVCQLVTMVVNVLHAGTVEVTVTLVAILTFFVNVRTVCSVVVMWSVIHAV